MGTYIGLCGKCLEYDATHEEWVDFGPIEQSVLAKLDTVLSDAGLPSTTMQGVWSGVCDFCCDKTAEHRKATSL